MSASPDPLVGTGWIVAELDGVAIAPDDDPPTIAFLPEARVAGHAGVNRFAGDYALADGILTLGPLAMTRMAGPPERMDRESRLVALLGAPLTYRLAADHLVLADASTTIRFTRAAPEEPA